MALDRAEYRIAEETARRMLQRSSNDAEALYLLGSTLLFEGRFEEALEPLRTAFAKVRRRGTGYRLGHCHLALGDFAQAETVLRSETQAHPDYANAHNTLGVALVHQGKREQALACFVRATQLDPDHAEANNNAGSLLHELDRSEEALVYLRRATAAQPALADAHLNLGLALHALRRYEEAVQSFRRVVELSPGTPYALSSLVWSERFACNWEAHASHMARLRAQVRERGPAAVPFTLLAVSDSLAEQRQCAEAYARDTIGGPKPALCKGTPSGHTRIRLAYLSADFRDHVMAWITAQLFEMHDRRRFEVFGVSYGPDDRSAMRTRLERAFDRFVDVRSKTDAQAAALLRDMDIDIAIDLQGLTTGARLGILAHRPAPLQVTYLGYPGTTGAPFIDYLIADRVVIPPSDERFFVEKVVTLPDSYHLNDPIAEVATPSRSEVGLPDDAFVYCCFNNTYKFTPKLFEIWMRLLRQRPQSVLWLLQPEPAATKNLVQAARASGIEAARLVFAPRLPRAEHFARNRLADLFLDTLPYNAHATASDALWAGVPVLTCRGTTFAGRVAASLLSAAGLPELITSTLEQYEDLAIRLASDRSALETLRNKLARHRETHALFDVRSTCRHLESALATMCERQRRGGSPRPFSVARLD